LYIRPTPTHDYFISVTIGTLHIISTLDGGAFSCMNAQLKFIEQQRIASNMLHN